MRFDGTPQNHTSQVGRQWVSHTVGSNQYREPRVSQPTFHSERKIVTCYLCKEVGHKSYQCPSKLATVDHTALSSSNNVANGNAHGIVSPNGNTRNMFLKGSIGEQAVIFHLDTGTSRTVLAEKIWLNCANRPPLKQCTIELRSVNDEKLQIIGETEIDMTVGQQRLILPVLIARNVKENCFLGIDGISKVQGGKQWLDNLVSLFENYNETEKVELTKMDKYRHCFIGEVEVNLKEDDTIDKMLLSEEVWRKAGYQEEHLEAATVKHVIYGSNTYEVLGEGSVQLSMNGYDMVMNSTICRKLTLDGVLGSVSLTQEITRVRIQEPDDMNNEPELFESQMNNFLEANADLFAESITDLSPTSTVFHCIDTKDAKPIKQNPRRLPFHLRSEIEKTVNELIESHVIVPSKSNWASNIVPVRKKDGTIRVCVDFRDLNDRTVKDCYPVPRIDDTIDKFNEIKEFSTLDCFAGYYQVLLHESDRHKTAFTTPFGLFEYVRMPFGLCNAPATFQRLMDQVLNGLIGSFCLVYLDDVIVYSKTKREHLEHLRIVFDRLRKNFLKLKRSKCHFMKQEVEYLGHVLTRNGLLPQQSKLDILSNFPRPSSVTQLQSFIGLASYYRRFVNNFSKIASVLHKAASTKNKKLEWSEDCQTAFDILKKVITSDSILIFPDFTLLFRLETDACNYGVGAVLSQKKYGKSQPIGYWSRHLNKAQQNNSMIEKKLWLLY